MMLWYTARGAGLAALVLLTASVVIGALVSRRTVTAQTADPGLRYIGQYLHRTFAGLGLVVLVVHVGTIIADSYANVGLTGAIVPFTSEYRTGWVAVGTISAYLFIGVAILGAARGRMATTPRGATVWRALHSLAYLGVLSAMLHGFTSGTDSSVGWVRAIYVACLVAVLLAVGFRITALTRSLPADVDAVLATPGTAPARPSDRFAGRTTPAPTGPIMPPTTPATTPVRIGASR